MIKLTDFYHQLIHNKTKKHVAIDMTCGHGHDTLFLSKVFAKVYAFDIQADAIQNTKKRTSNQNNVTIIRDNHNHFDQYINENIDVAIYNLGYLPRGNKAIKTNSKTTLSSLAKLCGILNDDGMIVLELYPHNPQEKKAVMAYTQSLQHPYDVIQIDLHNRHNSPNLIIIKKSAN